MTNFSVSMILLFSLLQSHGIVELEASTNEPYRTGFHFQPAKNWMNELNNIIWAYPVSLTMSLIQGIRISFTIAIAPSQPSDQYGCWSGSATIPIFYTGTIDSNNTQVQNLVIPKNYSDRDLTTAWLGPDKRWRMLIGSIIDNKGLAILYRSSKDFKHWTKAKHPLHSDKHTGMWECPDFYPLSTVGLRNGVDTLILGPNVKHVLKASLGGPHRDCYTIGTYNISKDKFILDQDGSLGGVPGLRYDYEKFYASKTFYYSTKNRRILWGWVNESSSVDDDIKKGWYGLQAIPKSIGLDKSGKQLVQWPVVEIESLRVNKVELPSKFLEGGSVLQVSGVMAAHSSLYNKNDKTSYGAFLDPVHEKLSLRSLIDHSIVENFGGDGKACITARVYQTLAIEKDAHLYAFDYGTESVKISSLSAWSMKKAKIN
ncbi:hypothetical protein ACOSP7_020113 [Xanthoceras sorbifolium]